MKTSKKLLSLFLAVVMAVTSCSVGFSAFAYESNKSIWSTDADSKASYDALDQVVSEAVISLLGNESIKATLEKSLGLKITDSTSINDVLGAVQPLLLGLLEKTTQKEFEEANGVAEGTYDFLNIDRYCSKCGNYFHASELKKHKGSDDLWCPNGCKETTTVKDEKTGKEEKKDVSTINKTQLSYFTLVSLCEKYKDDKGLSKEDRESLQQWYDKLIAYTTYGDAVIYNFINRMDYKEDLEENIYYSYTSVYNTDFEADATPEELELAKGAISLYNKKLESYGIPQDALKIETIADAIFYFHSELGQRFLSSFVAYDAIKSVNGDTKWTGTHNPWDGNLLYNDDEPGFEYKFDKDVSPYDFDKFLEEYKAQTAKASEIPVYDENNEPKLNGDGEVIYHQTMNNDFFKDRYAYLNGYEGTPFTEEDMETLEEEYTYGNLDTMGDAISVFTNEVFEAHNKDIIYGLAIKYADGVNNKGDLDKLVKAAMPDGWKEKEFILSNEDLNDIGYVIRTINNKETFEGSVGYFAGEKFTFQDTPAYYAPGNEESLTYTVVMPDVLKDTYVAKYLGAIYDLMARAAQNSPDLELYKKLRLAFFPNSNKAYTEHFVTKKYVETNGAQDEIVNGNVSNIAYSATGLPLMKYSFNHKNGCEPDIDTLNNVFFQAAEDYAYAEITQNLLGVDCLVNDSLKLKVAFDYSKAINQIISRSESSGSILSSEDKNIIGTTCNFTGEIGEYIVNKTLNTKIVDIVGSDIIKNVLSSLLVSPVDLTTALKDVWSRLNDSPVGTIVELLPVLTVVIDELLLPILLNENGDQMYAFLTKAFANSMLGDGENLNIIDFREFNIKNGSYIGLTNLHWDLNKLLPDILHLLLGDKDYSYTYYTQSTVKLVDVNKLELNGEPIKGIDDTTKYFKADELDTSYPKHYKVADAQGNALTRKEGANGANATFTYRGKSSTDMKALLADYPDAVFTCEMTYSSSVPFITGIYYVDDILKDVRVSDLKGVLTKALDGNETVAVSLTEAITEIATTFTKAVDEFVATPEYRNDTKINAEGNSAHKGLNNLFVAIPRLFDLFENIAADKYGIDKGAWVYCYDGRITTKDGSSQNTLLARFNSYAASNDANRKYDIFDTFSEILIENWLNAILSLVNNVVSTDNKIASNLPIISGLLNALGGFGENSILTDIVNSVFQITRDDDFSFTLNNENTDKNNKFTGLGKENAYFLITNLPRLIEVIKNLTSGGSTAKAASEDAVVSNPAVAKAAAEPNVKTANAKANNSNYSSADLSNAEDLIKNLDKMLSSLLSDATLNDFSLSKTENLVSGLVTFLSNYLGKDFSKNKDDIVRLLDSYLYYITGSGSLKADGKNNVDAKKVYTNNALTGLVVETYSLVEKLAGSLLDKYTATYTLDDKTQAQYNLLVEAISGVISPDVVSIRLKDDYSSASKTIAKYNSWSNMAAATSRGQYKVSINWNIKAGDKDAFYNGLAASLRVLTSIIGVLLVDTGWYDTIVTPVLGALCTKNGIKLTTNKALLADKEKTGYYDKTLIAVIDPLSQLINKLLKKPATTLIQAVQGLAGLLDDKNGASIASVLKGAITPISNEVKGLANILDKDVSNLTPTGAKALRKLATDKLDSLTKTDKNNALVNIKIKGIALSGANLIPIINKALLADMGITLLNINWNKLSTAKTPAAALVYFLEYVLENVIGILELDDLLGDISAKDLLSVLNQILEASDSPTMAYWTFAQYLQERSTGFKYPAGITAKMASDGVDALDQLVAGIFPLLSSFGLDIGNDLQGVLNKNLFTNSLLTKLATALYGALDGLDPTIKSVLNGLGIVTSTKDVAKLLTDKSYGATYSSAAKAISSQSNWSNVKNVNWGFKDGAANAQQGFVNALAAILRPVDGVLAVFLNEGTLHIDDTLYGVICSLNVAKQSTSFEFEIGSQKFKPLITYAMSKGVLTLTVKDANSKDSKLSTLKLDFKSLKNLDDLKLEGTNGYNSAIIPLLEALKCSNVKTYAQYQKDVAKAKDNLLLDVLNPIVGASSSSLLSKLAKAPATTLTELLPNIAMYLDGNGLVQLVTNLLAPITYILGEGDNPSVMIGELIESLLGAPIEDMIIPLLNGLLEDIGIVLPEINWAFLASLGTASSYKSKAVDQNGKYLTGKTIDADNGKVLVTVLRYVADVLIKNAKTLKNLITGIDAVKKNDLISSIVKSVFNTIGTASKDEIVCAVFYLLSSRPTNAFWDYTEYETGKYSFAYPEGVDVDFLKNLPPMLDGLIGGLLNLNELVSKNLFTDKLVSKLATGLYGAIEGVKISDDLNLAQLLAQTDIDFTTANVAKLLTDKDYGKTFEGPASVIKSAGSWKNVNADSLKWGVTDRDSFFHALVAVLRPIYGVLDVLLNDAYLGLFDLVRIPGSNGYTSSIVPLMEAFSMYNIKTQYQYREDMKKEYDAILLDIINPIWDFVEDVLNAPVQTIAKVVPNLALFIGNDGLCQIIENLFTPVSALADAIRPVVDLNSLLTTIFDALDVDLNSLLGKIGVKNFNLDLYDLKETLKPLLGGDAIIPLVNNILGLIKIKGTPLALKLNPVDWLQLASHGTTIVSASQAATFGSRIYVEGDSSETLIAVLKYLIITINTGENYNVITDLIGGLLGGADSDMSGTINEVLGIIKGDTDTVIASLVELLQTIA